ncbi:MAG: HPr(Ser) kinase/phosphatase [Halothiobacillus sp.]
MSLSPPPTILPLNFEQALPDTTSVYHSLFDARLKFARFNPLDPQPIAFIDPSLRAALDTRQEPLTQSPIIYILTEITPEAAVEWAQKHTASLATFLHTHQELTTVREWLFTRRRERNREWQHGVFMEVAGSGVLITGHSGIGKSELALELLSRGHRLIADDAPYFVHGNQGIEGHCPENIRDLLEVRGLGIINVRSLFGDNALKSKKNLHLIIELYSADHKNLSAESRLHGERSQLLICNEAIPLFRLPIAPGRNIAVFVETVVRQHNLERSGNEIAWSGLNPHRVDTLASSGHRPLKDVC